MIYENIVEHSCDTITPEMKELVQEMRWKQFFFTDFSYRCSSETGGRNKMLRTKKITERRYIFIKAIVIRSGFAVLQVRHTDFSSLLGKADYVKD